MRWGRFYISGQKGFKEFNEEFIIQGASLILATFNGLNYLE